MDVTMIRLMKSLALVILVIAPSQAWAAMTPAAPKAILTTEVHAEDFGAIGDGVSDDTKALQAAIDATALKHATLILKPGTYLTGSLFLKSGMALRLDRDVHLVGQQTIDAYPKRPTRIAGIEIAWPSALINIYGQSDVRLYGEGTIDGNGKVFWERFNSLRKDYEPRGLRWAADYDAERPRLIQVFNSQRVEIGGGLMLRRSGFWTVQLVYSHDVKVSGVTIRNNVDGKGPSTDGIDIDSSHHVLVEGADIDVNDDALCLKAGRDSDGLRVNRPTEYVVIRNSTIRSGAAGVTIGSETSGGVRHIEVYGLNVVGPASSGILFKSAHTRGGTVSDINIHDIDASGVTTVIRADLNWNPAYSYATIPPGTEVIPAHWKVLATPVSEAKGLPHFRDIRISHIKAGGAKTAIRMEAYANAPLESFTFRNLDIEATSLGTLSHARGFAFKTSRIIASDGQPLTLEDVSQSTGVP